MAQSSNPVGMSGKIVLVTIEWPEDAPYDIITLSSAIGK